MARFGTFRGSGRHQGVLRSLPHLLKSATRTGGGELEHGVRTQAAHGDEVAFSICIAKGTASSRRELNNNQLIGPIPPELGRLTCLFDLSCAMKLE